MKCPRDGARMLIGVDEYGHKEWQCLSCSYTSPIRGKQAPVERMPSRYEREHMGAPIMPGGRKEYRHKNSYRRKY